MIIGGLEGWVIMSHEPSLKLRLLFPRAAAGLVVVVQLHGALDGHGIFKPCDGWWWVGMEWQKGKGGEQRRRRGAAAP